LANRDIDWIVCHALERRVVDGRVPCPEIGKRDPRTTIWVENCLLCRHLIATPIDRRPEGMCAIEIEPDGQQAGAWLGTN
jgi:hypothetical protein